MRKPAKCYYQLQPVQRGNFKSTCICAFENGFSAIRNAEFILVNIYQSRRQRRGMILGREDPLEEEMVTHSSILTCRTPWTEKPGGLLSIGSQSWMHLSMYTLERIFWEILVKRMKFWRPPCQEEEEEGFANIILGLLGPFWVGV